MEKHLLLHLSVVAIEKGAYGSPLTKVTNLTYLNDPSTAVAYHNHNDINNNGTTNTYSNTETGGLCCSGTNGLLTS